MQKPRPSVRIIEGFGLDSQGSLHIEFATVLFSVWAEDTVASFSSHVVKVGYSTLIYTLLLHS